MELENNNSIMVIFIKDSLRMVNWKVKEFIGGKMEQSIEGHLKMDSCTGKAFGDRKKTTSMKGSIDKIKSMAQEPINGAME